ncbi:MAG: hypothetical protein Fur0023_04550 [Bacteroidia bacterium]
MNNIYINNQEHREIKNKIIQLIDQAQFEVIILSYRFSNFDILDAIKNFLNKTKNNPHSTLYMAIDTEDQNNISDNSFNDMQAYNFNTPIFQSLLELKNQFPDKFKISIYNTGKTMHHKMIIVDRQILGTGSFNFTQKADNENFENFFITSSKDSPKALKKAIKEAYRIMDIPFYEKPVQNIDVSIYPHINYERSIKTLYYKDTQTFISPLAAKLTCSAQNFMKLEIEYNNKINIIK